MDVEPAAPAPAPVPVPVQQTVPAPVDGEKENPAPKPKPAPPELGESTLPMARVQKIMKADKELPNVTKEAVHTISVATEEFIKRLSAAAYQQATRERRTMVQYKDVALAVKRNPELHFLEEMIPTAIPAPMALAQHKQKVAERNNAVKPSVPQTTGPSNGRKLASSKNGKAKALAVAEASTATSTEGTPDVADERNEMDLS